VPLTMYGIPNCDTIKKARTWLDDHAVAFTFHDYKKAGIDRPTLEGWVAEHGDPAKAISLMMAQPSMIKRPVLDLGDHRVIGFRPNAYAAAFGS
jgi:arsenate reductase